jgi:agmatine/peptidylarginine deiminase
VAGKDESEEIPAAVKEFLQLHQRTELQEYDLLRRPTLPVKLTRLLPEWERARYVILALPIQVFSQEEVSATFLEVIRHSLDVTDVILLVNDADLSNLWRLFQLLEKQNLQGRVISAFDKAGLPRLREAPGGAPAGPQGVIHIIPLSVDSYWVRDYGPVFATVKSNRLCILDSIYRDVRAEPSSQGWDSLLAGNINKRLKDDQVPTVLASLLATRHLEGPITLVRPPLQLWGGDLFSDGTGNGFTSSNTVTMNGGEEALVNATLREYYGLNRVTYLEPLPGSTIKHVDMFFRPADQNTFVLAQYPAAVPASVPVHDYLHKEVHATLERNAKILEKQFPGSKLIRVPMPPLSFIQDRHDMVRSSLDALSSIALSPADWLLQGELSGHMAGNYEDFVIDFALVYSRSNTKDVKPAGARSVQMLGQVSKWREAKGVPAEDVDQAENKIKFLGKSIKDLDEKRRKSGLSLQERRTLKNKTEEYKARLDELFLRCKYKSYLNAVHIKGRFKEKVLVPSYRAHRDMEMAVKREYQRAYPKAEIVFISADKLSEQYGALHCMTCVVPELPATSATLPPKQNIR